MVRAALMALIRRHAVLRTLYQLDVRAGAFLQVVLPVDGFFVPLVCSSSPAMRAADLERELRTCFDPFTMPPVRALLLLSEPPLLVVNMHHVAADMDAMAIVRSELTAYCKALALYRVPPDQPPLQYDYADYASWEQAHLPDDMELQWWVSLLEGVPDCIAPPRSLGTL